MVVLSLTLCSVCSLLISASLSWSCCWNWALLASISACNNNCNDIVGVQTLYYHFGRHDVLFLTMVAKCYIPLVFVVLSAISWFQHPFLGPVQSLLLSAAYLSPPKRQKQVLTHTLALRKDLCSYILTVRVCSFSCCLSISASLASTSACNLFLSS